MEFGVVWNVLQCQMWDMAQFILMWLWCGIRCDVEYVRYGVMLNVMLCNVRRGVKCGDAMWNDGVVHEEYGGVP